MNPFLARGACRSPLATALLALILGACASPAAMSDTRARHDGTAADTAASPEATPTPAATVAPPPTPSSSAAAAPAPAPSALPTPSSPAPTPAESPATAPAASPAQPAPGAAPSDVAQAGVPAPVEATAPAALPPAAPKPTPAPQQPYAGREDARAFARGLETSRGIDATWTLAQLDRAVYVPQVAKLMMPPPAGTAKDWAEYRARFVEPRRIAAGAAFWRANEAWLERAQLRWGVPPWLVVGVVGVETYYGRITGHFRVIDALATLSFDFPAGRRDRSPFFTAQLEEYLHWCQREALDPQSVLGSYAGAIGLPQFMPGSINRWAVDFDEDGRIDLQRNPADVVGSVAHYMAAHGWQRDMPTTYDVLVPVDAAQRAALLAPDIVPTFSAAQLQAQGAVLRGRRAREHDGPLALVELQNGDKAPSYVAGTENFYVVTRYNWSSYYAMAVIELGRAVEADLRRAGRGPGP